MAKAYRVYENGQRVPVKYQDGDAWPTIVAGLTIGLASIVLLARLLGGLF